MGKKIENTYFSLANYSDAELRLFRDRALEKHDKVIEEWAVELADVTNQKDFDRYTKKGEKQFNKVNMKFAEPLAEIEETLSMIQTELDKRETYNEQQRYIDGGKYEKHELDANEFLEKELEKTKRIRSIIDITEDM